MAKRFRIAFSFAGEKRDFVAQVADLLAAQFSKDTILYDKYHNAEFSRSDLAFYLPDLYEQQADLIVVVYCQDYDSKEWCGLEWNAIYGLLKKRQVSEVMLTRFDRVEGKGLRGLAGYTDLDDMTPQQTADEILKRLALNDSLPTTHYLTSASQLDDQEITHYQQVIEKLHASLPLAGFKTKLRVPIDLQELYVPLHAAVDLRATGSSCFADAEEASHRLQGQSQEITLMEAFHAAQQRKRRALVILGDPGSGKTTHLKRLLLACLRQGPASLGLPDDTLLPVYLPLRELVDLNSGIDAFIERTLSSPHLVMQPGFGRRLLARGHLLLLFDGLDEVTDPQQRAKVAHWIEQAAQLRNDCPVVVTCRFAGYDQQAQLGNQFLELHLRPLTSAQAELFIRNWYHAVETGLTDAKKGQIAADERANDLIERLQAPDFRTTRMTAMTRNPLLLANLCLVHRDRGVLPQGRHQLYDECIEVLLERWREAKKLTVTVSAQLGRRALQPVALYLHQQVERTRASAAELAPQLEPVLRNQKWPGGDAHAFLRTVRDESGLLTGWSHDQFGFMHLGFQEYLAACELRRQAFEDDKTAVLQQLVQLCDQSWWQEVILLMLAQDNPALFNSFMQVALQQPAFEQATELFNLILEEAANVNRQPFEEALKQTAPADSPQYRLALTALERLLSNDELSELSQSQMQHPHADVRTWAARRNVAAQQTTCFSERGEVELVLIPAGRFLMGSPEGYSNEKPQHEVQIQAFYLARYPVTNAQYAQFLQANPDAPEPRYWGDRRFNQAQQPVVGVNWHDALRFADWAGGRLPSEAEWEYACRAGTQSAYWWGDEFDSQWANGSRKVGQTTPVGRYPANPFGLYDVSGNVWEWCADTWHDTYQGAPVDGSAWQGRGNARSVRGGGWSSNPWLLRSAGRGRSTADAASSNPGFRLARTR